MTEVTTINPSYGTTRTVTRQQPVIEKQAEDKFETFLFLPEGAARQGEGGLRTQGYFKTSLEGKPLITVVTVVFNGEQFLEETILSVMNQTYENIEYIIIDGGSTDGTLNIIKKYENSIDYWVSEYDRGIYDAMNKGIALSQGDFIGFLNADDLYNLEVIEELSNALSLNDFDFAVGVVNLINRESQTIGLKRPLKSLDYNKGQYIKMPTAHMAFFIKRKLLKQNGGFDKVVGLSSDYDLILRTLLVTNRVYHFKETVGSFRDGGVSSSYFKSFLSTYKVHKKNGIPYQKRSSVFLLSMLKKIILNFLPSFMRVYLLKRFGSGRFELK